MAPKSKKKKVQPRKPVKKVSQVQKIKRTDKLQVKDKVNIDKLNAQQVDKLKGKLVRVKRAGATPVFVEVTKKDDIKDCLIKADIPIEDAELKIEAIKNGSKKWSIVKETDRAINYETIVVTTKVRGSF